MQEINCKEQDKIMRGESESSKDLWMKIIIARDFLWINIICPYSVLNKMTCIFGTKNGVNWLNYLWKIATIQTTECLMEQKCKPA